MTSQTTAPTTPPAQAWAHREGRVDLHPLAAADWGIDALTARARIAEAFHHFGIGHDEARVDVLASCFTEDAVFEVAEASAQPFTRFEGRAEICERLAAIIEETGDQRRHAICNIVVQDLDLAAGTATALAYGVVTLADGGLSLQASVIYDARLAREADGCWRFTAFFIGLDRYMGTKPVSGERAPKADRLDDRPARKKL